MRLAVVGANGRMGRAVVRLAREQGMEIVCAVGGDDIGRDAGEVAGVGRIGTDIVGGLTPIERARAHVVIDFSTPTATAALGPIAASAGTAIVTGTTGLGDDARAALDRAAERVPVLWEPNMSVGVHALTQLVRRAVEALPGWDVEVVEVHHRAKVDAPSGTALRLVEAAQHGRASPGPLAHGRQGRPGPRPGDEIGLHAVRGGDVIGDHSVHLLGPGERLELVHRATSRDVFAHGALRAAAWIQGRPAGRYTLNDVIAAAAVKT